MKLEKEIMIKPYQLKENDHVAIVSLSSGILGEPSVSHQLKLGIKRLKELSLIPVFMPHSLKGLNFIKDHPEKRAEDLKQAFKDEKIKAIICAIGGDDTYKIIPYLMEDIEFKELVKRNPKIFIGFSDSTNNHFMFHKLGLITYYGLNFLSDLCELETKMLPYTKESYKRLFKNQDTYKINASPFWYENRNSYDSNQLNKKLKKHDNHLGYEVLYGKGLIKGKLFGGCLESIYDLYTSSRYLDQRSIYDKYDLIPKEAFYKDKILFLETSEEKMKPEEFSSIMNYFIENKVLTSVKALIVGKPYDEIYYNEYKEILKKIGKDLELPILYNMNFGHSLPRTMMPYGVESMIDFDKKEFMIIEKIFKT